MQSFGSGAAPRVVRAPGAAGGAAAAEAPAAAAPVLPPRVRHAAGETQPEAQVGTGRSAAAAPPPERPERLELVLCAVQVARPGQRVPPAAGAARVAAAGLPRQVALVPALPRGRAPAAAAAAARRLLQPRRAVPADDGAGHRLSPLSSCPFRCNRCRFDWVRVGQCPVYFIYSRF